MNPRVSSGAREKISAQAAADMITNNSDESTDPEEMGPSDEEEESKKQVKQKQMAIARTGRPMNRCRGPSGFYSRGKQMVNMVVNKFKNGSSSPSKSSTTTGSSSTVTTNRRRWGGDPHDDDAYDFKDQQTPPKKKTYEKVQRKQNGNILLRAVNDHHSTSSANNTKRPPHLPHKKKRIFEEDSMDLSIKKTDEAKRKRKDEEKVDYATLRELPDEIKKEMCEYYGIDLADLEEQPSPVFSPVEIGVEAQLTNYDNPEADSTDDTIEAVLKASKAEAEALNPYENVDEIDPTFLCALPNNLRNEVLLQVQEAKEKRGIVIPQNLLDSPQPCSSRQFLERQRLRREAAEKAAAEAAAAEEAAAAAEGAIETTNTSPLALISSGEDLIEVTCVLGGNNNGFLETPPPASPQVFTPTPPSSSATTSRLNANKSSSTRRKLNFDAVED